MLRLTVGLRLRVKIRVRVKARNESPNTYTFECINDKDYYNA